MATSEIAQRISETRYDDTDYKKKKNAVARKLGWAVMPFPEVEIEAEQPLLLQLVDSIVKECIADVAEMAEVDETTANGLISRSLGRIHFAGK